MLFTGPAREYLCITVITSQNCHFLKEKLDSGLTVLWSTEDDNLLKIDSIDFKLAKNKIEKSSNYRILIRICSIF
jgi:hypothetical protein